jgi:hypothetical protein
MNPAFLLTIFIMGLSACAAPSPPTGPASQPLRTLASEHLEVEVMNPDAPDRYYRGQRFSPVATVLRVRMDGHDFLFAPIEHDPLADGGGLAMEFDIGTEPNPPPPGFNEAAAGEGFLKIGVGVLRKEADPIYKFYGSYAMIQPAVTTVKWERDRARFHQTCEGVAGYAYRLEADVRVVANEVRVTCRLANTGAKPFSTEQYAHNFFAFDEQRITPGYAVEFPYDFSAVIPKPVIKKTGRILTLTSEITPKIKAAQAHVTPLQPLDGKDSVIFRHPDDSLRITATVSRPAIVTTVHMAPLYVCPEQFVRLELQPGETVEWTRNYVFETGFAAR